MKRAIAAGISTLLFALALPAVLQSLGNAEASPQSKLSQTTSKLVRAGQFQSGEHPTFGGARIVEIGGKPFVELDGKFKTDAGPDLFVILHRSKDVIGTTKAPAHSLKAGDYIALAPLRATKGSQRYAIPASTKLAEYGSVAIWCRQFNATFGAAMLK